MFSQRRGIYRASYKDTLLSLFYLHMHAVAIPVSINVTGTARFNCYCVGGCLEVGICDNAIMCYTFVSKFGNKTNFGKGCIFSETEKAMFCVNKFYYGSSKSDGMYYGKCCIGHLCNNGSLPYHIFPVSFGDHSVQELLWNEHCKLAVAIAVPVSLLLIAATFVCLCKLKRRKHPLYPDTTVVLKEMRTLPSEENSVAENNGYPLSSGRGVLLLVQRTLAKQIELIECVGKGKCEVWKGKWQEEEVAVKIFSSRNEASWLRETEIYSTIPLNHENVLCFIGSDVTSSSSCTQLWLVTQYHVQGSLYNYLNNKPVTIKQMLTLATSAISGLRYLHQEVYGTRGKPAIAHRDIKTKNILVKDNGTCCIADFGLAVTHTQTGNLLYTSENQIVGTIRYMAPELLSQTMNNADFESYCKLDIYAFGLVLWEMCWRCENGGAIEQYRPPFFDMVPDNPSVEEMTNVVSVNQQRPFVPSHWISNHMLNTTIKIMKECWHQNPSVRPTSLRIKKTLLTLHHQ